MLARELIHSCSNEHVAAAALACIGGVLALRVRTAAELDGLTPGAFAARAVRQYRFRKGDSAFADLAAVIRGDDAPILAGLRHIVEISLLQRRASAWASQFDELGLFNATLRAHTPGSSVGVNICP